MAFIVDFLFEIRGTEVRAVNRDVAQRARLEEARLIVERRSARSAAEARCGVALETEQIHIAHLQHVGVRPAMHYVARYATIRFDRRMLVHERPFLLSVALEANLILIRGHPHLARALCSVHVVAIVALNETFINAVVERHGELRLLREMARVAKFRLRFNQQKLLGLRVVRRVARDAAHIVARVNGINGIHVLISARVAGQTAVGDLFDREIFERDDFGL